MKPGDWTKINAPFGEFTYSGEKIKKRSMTPQSSSTADPIQEFFSIGEVCELTGLKPHVLRYWESQFRFLSPAKNRSGNRVYQRREVELITLVKHLLYEEKYTIEGARQKVDEHRKGGDLKLVARGALAVQSLESLESDLKELIAMLGSPNATD
jgi:DNA-binding transcriptional MerR regulator